jgi:hypothetical protein
MGVFVRAVISGFGFSLGAALFKKLSRTIGFEEGAGNGESSKRGDRSDPDGSSESDGDGDGDAGAGPRVTLL